MLRTSQALSNIGGAIQTGMKLSPLLNKSHTDTTSLLSAFDGDMSNSMYLGLMKLWYQQSMLSTPLISMTELEGNVLYTNGFNALLGFSVPYNLGFPKIKENLCGDLVKPGIGGEEFPIVFTEDVFTKGDVITSDYRNGKQLVVGDTPSVPYGSGYKIMVKLATYNEEDDYYPPQFLEPGTQYMRIDNPSGEYDTNSGKLYESSRTGLLNYSYQTGGAEMSLAHWITSYGDQLSIQDIQKNPAMMWMNQYGDLKANNAIMNLYNIGKDGKPIAGSMRWMPSIIYHMQMELAHMKEKRLMWGHGFNISGLGKTSTRVASGYYPQIKNRGNYQTYSDFTQLPNKLKNIVGDLYATRHDIPRHKRRVKFRMGYGAYVEMQKAFMTQFKSDNPFTIMGDHKALDGMLTGSFDNLSYKPIRVTSVQYPEVGLVEIEHDPILDLIDVENPNNAYNGMYPNSSYMIFVEDLTTQDFSDAMPKSGYNVTDSAFNNGSNVMMIKPKDYYETMSFEVGMGCNPTLKQFIGQAPNSQVVSTKNKGFGVTMHTCGELWVKDPSRVVLLEYLP